MPKLRLDLNQGQYLFATRCSACHTIGGESGVGPDLAGIAATRDSAWLARFIKTPDKVLAEKDPIAMQLFRQYKQVQMPNLRLGDGDVDAIIHYLAAQKMGDMNMKQDMDMKMEH